MKRIARILQKSSAVGVIGEERLGSLLSAIIRQGRYRVRDALSLLRAVLNKNPRADVVRWIVSRQLGVPVEYLL
jgi:hypothetical protein